MTRAIDSDQSPLYRRSDLARLDLVVLTTYSDREAETEDTTFYFAREPIQYKWDAGSTIDFWPVLKEIGPLSISVNHLPSPNDSELFRKPLEITLSNEAWADDRLINVLRDGHTLENATVTWAQILLDARPNGTWNDLTAMTGDEHTVFYRGRVTRVGPITNETVTLRCELDLPEAPFPKALDASTNDPDDYGRRFPLVYGAAKRVKAIGYQVGWVTTLAEDITDSNTGTTKFTDLTGVSGSFTFRIGAEEVSATYISDTTANITARAQNSTTAAAHNVGAPAVEMVSSFIFVVAGHPVSAIDEVYIENPVDGSLFRLDSGEFSYTKDTADASTVSGQTVASVTFTQAQLRSVVEYLSSTGDVTQQPDFEVDSGEYVFVPATAFQAWTAAHTYCLNLLDVDGGRVYGGSLTDTDGVEWYWPNGSIADSSREVVRWRIKAVCSGRGGQVAANYDTYYDIEPDNISNLTAHAHQTFTDYSNPEYFATATTAWATPAGGTTLGDLESASGGASAPRLLCDVYQTGTGSVWDATNFAWSLHGDVGLDVELVPQTVTRTDDVEIDALAAAMGKGIKIWADVDGYEAPTANPAYKSGAGSLMTAPCDIMRHWIERSVSQIGIYDLLEGDYDNANETSYTTGTIAPSADVTLLVGIRSYMSSGGTPNTPSLSGCSVSWTLVATNLYSDNGTSGARISLFRGSDSSPSSDQLMIDFSGQTQYGCSWVVTEITGSDTTTNDGIVQSSTAASSTGTALTVTLAAFADSANRAFGLFADGVGWTAESNYYEIASVESILFAEIKNGEDTSVTATAGYSGGDKGGIAVEIDMDVPSGPSWTGITIDPDTYDECSTNLGSAAWAFDARTLGDTWQGILAAMAFNARTTPVLEESSAGTVCKLLTANTSYQFSAASFTISEWDRDGFVEADQDVTVNHASRFRFVYAPDWSRGSGEEAFTQNVVANEDTNDLSVPSTADFATAAATLGSYEADPEAFKCIQVEATAEEIAGYYCHERIRVPIRLLAVRGVPWWEAYALEVGDIVSITPPWDTSAIKARVLEYTKNPETEQIELRLIEVE